MSHHSNKNKQEEVVATGKALQLAAQWLGLQETDVSEAGDTEENIASGSGQYAGLGYGKRKSSKKNMWKLEERLGGTLSHSSKKRKHSVDGSIERKDNKKYGKSTGKGLEDEEEEEEMGRSGAFASSKAGPSLREELLTRRPHGGTKKK